VRTYFGISSHDEAFEPTFLYYGFWEFQLDTKRDGEFDFYLGFFYNRRENRLFCSFRAGGSTLMRHRRARYDPERGVFCRIPTPWLKVRKQVEFVARASLQGKQVDRDPDQGRYVGL
jgi:hypothetical protein